MPLSLPVPLIADIGVWLTPVWLLGVGAALALLVLAIVVGIVYLVHRRAGAWVVDTLFEGPVAQFLIVAAFLGVFSLLITLVVPYKSLFRSLAQLPFAGEVAEQRVEAPAAAKREVFELGVPTGTLDRVVFKYPMPEQPAAQESSEEGSEEASGAEPTKPLPITLMAAEDAIRLDQVRIPIEPGQEYVWERGPKAKRIFDGENASFALTNPAGTPVAITINAVTRAEFLETSIVPKTALGVLIAIGLYLLLKAVAPKVSAIALAAAKEGSGQPIYLIAMAAGVTLLILFVFIPYNTFGEDVKFVKDSGMTLIMIFGIVVALWTASVSVAEEIEGRTALTVLSKPIGRRQFVVGKFVGILLPVAIMFVVLGIILLATVSFKVVYDAKEASQTAPTWRECYVEMISVLPGLALAFMEAVVLAAISVAISTRLPMLANLIICSAIYVLGHLVPMLVHSTVNEFEPVRFVGNLFATVLPVLDHFNIQAAIAGGAEVPWIYLAWALLYCVLYSSIAMLFALVLFEDRDLA